MEEKKNVDGDGMENESGNEEVVMDKCGLCGAECPVDELSDSGAELLCDDCM